MKQERRSMPPRLSKDDDRENKKVNLLLDPELADEINAWRSKQPGLPNLSLAIRELITRGLTVPNTPKPAPKKSSK